MTNLEPLNWLEDAQLNLITYRLNRVGRKNMTNHQLWREWLERE